jgi:AcrR family transcriptional regulator
MSRMTKEERTAKILKAAMDLSERKGYTNITMRMVADRAKCSRGLVEYYMGSSEQMARAIVIEAVKQRNMAIIAQALIEKHPQALAHYMGA